MKVAFLLHAYQPPTQFPEITRRITRECYRPLVKLLLDNSQARITLNFVGSLTEQLVRQGERELLKHIAYLIQQNQVELTGTPAYHPLLTTLPKPEIVRQDKLNKLINQDYFGESVFKARGFFLPEMFYERQVGEVINQLGYQWVVVDETAFPSVVIKNLGDKQHKKLHISQFVYRLSGTNLKVFFRDDLISLQLALAPHLSVSDFVGRLKEHYLEGQEGYAVVALDAETFGHHHTGRLKLLEKILNHPNIQTVTMSEVLGLGLEEVEIDPKFSTWGQVTENEDTQERLFLRWNNPDNQVHQLQWQLYELMLANINHVNENKVDLSDKAIHSDFFYWGGHDPVWHPQMVERGAKLLRDAIFEVCGERDKRSQQAQSLYQRIVKTGNELYGEKIVL